MASESGPTPDPLKAERRPVESGKPRSMAQALNRVEFERRLNEEPYHFGFFHTLRRLECLHTDRPRIGQSSRLAEEYVRLGQDPSLAFAPATLSRFDPGKDGRPPRLGVAFMGLFGPNGPLPLHLTEYAHARAHQYGDQTLARFADVFHHRLLSLFYRAWAQAQPCVSFDRPEADRFGDYVGSFLGIGSPALQDRDAAPDRAKLFYAGRFSLQCRNADGLRDLLEDYFEVPVALSEFEGSWIEIPEPERLRLGESLLTGALGVSTIVGSRVWDRQLKFRLICGPMGLEDYERLLPDRDSLARLEALVRLYTTDEFVWDLQLVLLREEIPRIELGKSGRLGWTTWLLSGPAEADSGDLVLDPVTSLRAPSHPAREAA